MTRLYLNRRTTPAPLKVVELKSDAVIIPSLKLLGDNPALYLFGLQKLGLALIAKVVPLAVSFKLPEYNRRALLPLVKTKPVMGTVATRIDHAPELFADDGLGLDFVA